MMQSKELIKVNDLAKIFHEILKSEQGRPGRVYLRQRGIRLDFAIEEYELGFCTKGFFANRIIFPVFDLRGIITTLTTRTVDPQEKKRHLHSPGIKMDWLYNETRITEHKTFPRCPKHVVLCESPIDVITLEQAGIESVGAMGASNMNRGKVMKLAEYEKVYIAFDNDINEAGQKAAERVGNMLASFNEGQEVYKIHIPFLLGADVNAMFLADPSGFKDNFLELMSDGVRILPSVNKDRKNKEQIGPMLTKYPIMDTIERYIDHIIPCGAGRYKSLCPFHEEEEPSFHIDEIKNRFKCFGCGKSGDTIDFLMFIHQKMGRNLGFKDAIAILGAHVPQ